MLTQSAEAGYSYDLRSLPQVQAIPFQQNEAVQQIVAAAVRLAENDLSNITQTPAPAINNGTRPSAWWTPTAGRSR